MSTLVLAQNGTKEARKRESVLEKIVAMCREKEVAEMINGVLIMNGGSPYALYQAKQR